MSVDAIVHPEFPRGYTVLFGADGKVIMTLGVRSTRAPSGRCRSTRHSPSAVTRRSPPTSTSISPPTRTPPPTWPSRARTHAERRKRYSFEDVLLIPEAVSTSSARKDYDDCTAKYGRYGIPIYLVVDPYAREVVLHTEPTASGYSTARTRAYGTGKLPIPLADGRTFALDLDELPPSEPEANAH